MNRAVFCVICGLGMMAATLNATATAAPPLPRDVLEGEVVYHIFQRTPLRPWQTALYRLAR